MLGFGVSGENKIATPFAPSPPFWLPLNFGWNGAAKNMEMHSEESEWASNPLRNLVHPLHLHPLHLLRVFDIDG